MLTRLTVSGGQICVTLKGFYCLDTPPCIWNVRLAKDNGVVDFRYKVSFYSTF